MGQKLQDGEKVLCVSLNSPHSERPPGQTAGPSNLPFWILGNHYRGNTHKKFHLPGTHRRSFSLNYRLKTGGQVYLKQL